MNKDFRCPKCVAKHGMMKNVPSILDEIHCQHSMSNAKDAALVKALDALEKISKWLKRLEDNSNLQAKNCGFESLSEANRLDAKNYQATRNHIEPVIAEGRKVLG